MQKIKSLAAVFLALFILAAIPTQALAAEAHVDAITAHPILPARKPMT